MAPVTMKAAVCQKVGQPIVVQELPVPIPTGRELLVRVRSASLCHSDINIVEGELLPIPTPIIIGHEFVAVVEALGPDAGAYGVDIGDHVGPPLWHAACMKCADCTHHGPQFCPTKGIRGATTIGCFAEYTLVDAAGVVKLPPALGDATVAASLAPLFCAGITAWDAIERAKLQIGETVAIVGVGGVGEFATRFAQAMGARVIALDVQEPQLRAVEESGSADLILNTTGMTPGDIAGKVFELNNRRLVSAAIVTSGAIAAYQAAMSVLEPGGRLVAVGISAQVFPVPQLVLAERALSLIGARVPGTAGAQRCLDFALRKNILPKVHPRRFRLEDINEMIDLMKKGNVHEGRMMVRFF